MGLLQLQAAPAAVRRRGTAAPGQPRAAAAGVPPLGASPLDVSEVARQNLKKAATACRRYGWISFWVQLVLNTVAAIVLLFSLAFTSQVGRYGEQQMRCRSPGTRNNTQLSVLIQELTEFAFRRLLYRQSAPPVAPSDTHPHPHPSQNGPSISLYLTLFGIVLGFLSLFWSFGYVRLSRKLRAFLEAAPGSADAVPKVRRSDVIAMLEKVRPGRCASLSTPSGQQGCWPDSFYTVPRARPEVGSLA